MKLTDREKIEHLEFALRAVVEHYRNPSFTCDRATMMVNEAKAALASMESFDEPKPIEPLTPEEISMLRAWLKRPRNWSA